MNTSILKDFKKLDLRTGTIIEAKCNPKAHKPAYLLTIDFGPLGKKTSSAQLTENYEADDLKGKQITAVVNFPAMHIAGIKSEVLVLGAVSATEGTVLLVPEQTVANGSAIS